MYLFLRISLFIWFLLLKPCQTKTSASQSVAPYKSIASPRGKLFHFKGNALSQICTMCVTIFIWWQIQSYIWQGQFIHKAKTLEKKLTRLSESVRMQQLPFPFLLRYWGAELLLIFLSAKAAELLLLLSFLLSYRFAKLMIYWAFHLMN